jgi:hypothetical protein
MKLVIWLIVFAAIVGVVVFAIGMHKFPPITDKK